jgi:hypothetical protein
MATAAALSAAAAPHRGHGIIERAIIATATGKRECREQATHLLTTALHTDHIIGVLMTNEEFKFGFAVRAIVLVQWHRKLPPVRGKRYNQQIL